MFTKRTLRELGGDLSPLNRRRKRRNKVLLEGLAMSRVYPRLQQDVRADLLSLPALLHTEQIRIRGKNKANVANTLIQN